MDRLVKQLITPFITEQVKATKVIAVYPGRFQPFGPHHKKVFQSLQKKFDDVYITTSNIKSPPRHPMNFKEKVRHMVKMGIPKNKIIFEKSPYVANNLLKKFDSDKTAVVYVFGAKDAGRLKGGKKKSGGLTYYQDYKKNKNNMVGYETHGYIYTAPHVKVSGISSGTEIRRLLGSPKFDEKNRELIFKKTFGYFDKGVYNMLTNKFKKLFEVYSKFIVENKDYIKKLIKEASTGANFPTDDGPPTFYKGFNDYETQAGKWIKEMGKTYGWEVYNYLISRTAQNPEDDYTLEMNIVPSVAFGRENTGEYGKRFGVKEPIKRYIEVADRISKQLGYEVIKYMGIKPDFSGYTGVEVEAPVLPGRYDLGNTKRAELTGKQLGSGMTLLNTLEESLDLSNEINMIVEDKKFSELSRKYLEGPLNPKPQKKSAIKDKSINENLLLEGGAYGHMAHPFDDNKLTFADLKKIIKLGLSGELNREDNVTEKTDGQNLMITYRDGKVLAARNKGQIKNRGQNALDAKGIAQKFSGRGDIRDAFVFAMKDLTKAINSLSDKQKDKIFKNGEIFMNLEIIYPASSNVIDYDKQILQFHNSIQYDKNGNAVGEVKGSGRMLQGMIKQVNKDIGKHFKIIKPRVLDLPKKIDFGKKVDIYNKRVDKLKNQYGLKDNDTLGKYHQSYWEDYIFNAGKQFGYTIPKTILKKLTKRWAFFDKSYKITNIKRDLKKQPKFLEWVMNTDKQDHKNMVKKNMLPFEKIFFAVGADILLNLSNFIAANPTKAVEKIRKDIVKASNKVRAGGDIKKMKTLKQQLEKLNSIGGLKKIVPVEGIVFKYKGKTYKFTGAFAPVNQILGLVSF